jgi:hypothetical protein
MREERRERVDRGTRRENEGVGLDSLRGEVDEEWPSVGGGEEREGPEAERSTAVSTEGPEGCTVWP